MKSAVTKVANNYKWGIECPPLDTCGVPKMTNFGDAMTQRNPRKPHNLQALMHGEAAKSQLSLSYSPS